MFTTTSHTSPAHRFAPFFGSASGSVSKTCCRCNALANSEVLPATLPPLRSLGGINARDPRTGGRLRDLGCDDCHTVWYVEFDRTDAMIEWQLAEARC